MPVNYSHSRIIISRTDSIGDVMLTLPLAGYLKKIFPQCYIIFLCSAYTFPLVKISKYVDEIANWSEISGLSSRDKIEAFKLLRADIILHVYPRKEIASIAAKAGIPFRIGSLHRYFHWFTCNKLPNFSRKRSNLHEAQLNFKLLKCININYIPSLEEIPLLYGIIPAAGIPSWLSEQLKGPRKNVVLHPKSKGSAREWPLDHYSDLLGLLNPGEYNIFITGTSNEGILMSEFLNKNAEHIIDLTGKLSLDELIAFLAKVDYFVSCSTGPLHIAASLGVHVIGLYPSIRTMHAGRWRPLGRNAVVLDQNKSCSKCRNSFDCECLKNISPSLVRSMF